MAAKVVAAVAGIRRIGDGMGLSGVGTALSVIARIGAVGGCCLALAHCGGPISSKVDPKYGVSASPRVVQFGEPVPKGGGTYRVGKPYMVGGQTYSPEENTDYSAEGIASWYGDDFHGRRTANGEVYDMQSISAAHPTLPIPSYARVTNLANQRSIIVRVNDRGPYHAGRLIDLSARTARLLGFQDNGTARVRVEYVGRASLGGLRRHAARGDASARHACAGARGGQACRLAGICRSIGSRGHPRRRADTRRASVRARARQDWLASQDARTRKEMRKLWPRSSELRSLRLQPRPGRRRRR